MDTSKSSSSPSRAGDLDSVREYVESGEIDVNQKGAQNRTAIHRAAGGNHVEIIEYLLQSGAPVDCVDKCLRTPLHWAVISGNLDATQLLLENGADLRRTTVSGMNPLMCSVQQGSSAVLDAILEWATPAVNDEGHEGPTVLELCEAVDAEGKTAIMLAKEKGDKQTVKLLKSYEPKRQAFSCCGASSVKDKNGTRAPVVLTPPDARRSPSGGTTTLDITQSGGWGRNGRGAEGGGGDGAVAAAGGEREGGCCSAFKLVFGRCWGTATPPSSSMAADGNATTKATETRKACDTKEYPDTSSGIAGVEPSVCPHDGRTRSGNGGEVSHSYKVQGGGGDSAPLGDTSSHRDNERRPQESFGKGAADGGGATIRSGTDAANPHQFVPGRVGGSQLVVPPASQHHVTGARSKGPPATTRGVAVVGGGVGDVNGWGDHHSGQRLSGEGGSEGDRVSQPRPHLSAAAGREQHSISLNGDQISEVKPVAAKATTRLISCDGVSIEGGKRGHDRATVSPDDSQDLREDGFPVPPPDISGGCRSGEHDIGSSDCRGLSRSADAAGGFGDSHESSQGISGNAKEAISGTATSTGGRLWFGVGDSDGRRAVARNAEATYSYPTGVKGRGFTPEVVAAGATTYPSASGVAGFASAPGVVLAPTSISAVPSGPLPPVTGRTSAGSNGIAAKKGGVGVSTSEGDQQGTTIAGVGVPVSLASHK